MIHILHSTAGHYSRRSALIQRLGDTGATMPGVQNVDGPGRLMDR
jgi:hypothetical protein